MSYILVLFIILSILLLLLLPITFVLSTNSPTTAYSTANSCIACSTTACVNYYHANGVLVQDIALGYCGVALFNPSLSYLTQTIDIGTYSSGNINLGGAQSIINIASQAGPAPSSQNPTSPSSTLSPTNAIPTSGATGTINLGANSPTPSSQTINIAPTTTGTITIGGSGSTVTIAPSTSGSVSISSSASGTVNLGVGMTGSNYINIGTAGARNQINIGDQTVYPSPTPDQYIVIGAISPTPSVSATRVLLGNAPSGILTIGPPTASVYIDSTHLQIGRSAGTPTSIELGTASKANVYVGDNTVSPSPTPSQTINIGTGAPNTIYMGGPTSTINIGPSSSGTTSIANGASGQVIIAAGSSTGAITMGANTGSPTVTSQTINLGASVTSVSIGTGSCPTVNIGGPSSTVIIGAQTPTSTWGIQIGSGGTAPSYTQIGSYSAGTTYLGLGASGPTSIGQAATGNINIGTSSSGFIELGNSATGHVRIGEGASATLSYGEGASSAIDIGTTAPTSGFIRIAYGSKAPISIGDTTVSPSPTPSQSITIGTGSPVTTQIGAANTGNTVIIGQTTSSPTPIATTVSINNAYWNQWGSWVLAPNAQAVNSGAFISFTSSPVSPQPTPSSPTIVSSFNTYAPSSGPSAIILGNCRAFVTNTGGTYYPSPYPSSVSWPCGTTAEPTPSSKPVTWAGDCVYLGKTGLYNINLNIVTSAITPTPSPAVINYVYGCYNYYSGSPTLAANGFQYPIVKDPSTSVNYYSTISHNYNCGSAPCLISFYMQGTGLTTATVSAYQTTLSVVALKGN